MFDKQFEELKMTGNLPSPSGVGLAILQLTATDDFTLADLAQAISADPALSSRILKLANSARSGSAVPVSDVASAAQRLGVRSVRSVALGFSLISANRSGVCGEFDYERYWGLSLSTAVLAQSIAKTTGVCSASEAFTCALLSRVGMLALASVHPTRYAKTLRVTRGSSLEVLMEAETAAFEINHAEVTAALLRDWRLPESFEQVAIGLGDMGRSSKALPVKTLQLLSVVTAAWMFAPKLLGGEDLGMHVGTESLFLSDVAALSHLERDSLGAGAEASLAAWQEWKALLEMNDRRPSTKPVMPAVSSERTTEQSFPELQEEEEESSLVDPLVMIVDDDERIIRLLTYTLEKGGFRSVVARNGHDALAMAREKQPQLVITDWMMPKMTGLELCHSLKQSESLRNSYIIMLSAEEAIGNIEEGFGAGADDYVCKPFSTSILMARVRAGRRVLELQLQLESERTVRTEQMAALGAMTRKLRSVAMTDSLTELPNRRYARKRLAEEWDIARSKGNRLSVVMIDIDHFKNVNDTHGHDVGDHVLRETARTLMENTRTGDVVCRFGGEEFLLINIDCARETGQQCCERLRAAVEANHIQYGTFDGNVTISLGLADYSAEMSDIDEFLRAADKAVYRAKHSGRNRIDLGVDDSRRSA